MRESERVVSVEVHLSLLLSVALGRSTASEEGRMLLR